MLLIMGADVHRCQRDVCVIIYFLLFINGINGTVIDSQQIISSNKRQFSVDTDYQLKMIDISLDVSFYCFTS